MPITRREGLSALPPHAVTSAEAPAPSGPYSQAIIAGQLVFLAGQRPVDPHSGKIPDGFTPQVEQALANVRAVLDAAGTDLVNVVKLTAYLADLDNFGCLNTIFDAWFTKPYPARTTVGVRLRGVLVELDVTAVLPSRHQDHPINPSEGLPPGALSFDGWQIGTAEHHVD